MIEEKWRDVPGYEGLYQVSNYGRVRSLDRYVWNRCRARGKRDFLKGSILRPQKHVAGYLFVALYKDGKKRQIRINRLVLTVFDRPPKEGEESNHMNGNKTNNYIDNLEWMTKLQNQRHAIEVLGKHNGGGKYTRDKLNEDGIRGIKDLLKEGVSQGQIAKRFNVCYWTIHNIKMGKSWKDII